MRLIYYLKLQSINANFKKSKDDGELEIGKQQEVRKRFILNSFCWRRLGEEKGNAFCRNWYHQKIWLLLQFMIKTWVECINPILDVMKGRTLKWKGRTVCECVTIHSRLWSLLKFILSRSTFLVNEKIAPKAESGIQVEFVILDQ